MVLMVWGIATSKKEKTDKILKICVTSLIQSGFRWVESNNTSFSCVAQIHSSFLKQFRCVKTCILRIVLFAKVMLWNCVKMSETSQKRSRKSKLVPRSLKDGDDLDNLQVLVQPFCFGQTYLRKLRTRVVGLK